MIYHTMIYWKVAPSVEDSPVFLHYSDSESFIKKQRTLHSYGETWYPTVHTWHHADVLLQLREAEGDIWPIQCKLQFVPSHQDKNTTAANLSPEAKLNQQCDDLCNEKLEELEKKNRKQSTTLLPAGRVYLECNGEIVNGREQHHLKNSIPGKELREYYMGKHGWTQSVHNHINWHDFGRARKRTETICRYVTKLCCQWLPTNDRMNLTDGVTDTCKVCGEKEDNDHLFSCNGSTEWRLEFYTKLYKHLVKSSTAATMIAMIMQGLRWQFENHDPTFAIDEEKQHKIGWHHLFRGWIDKTWQHRHEQYIQNKFPEDGKKRDTAKMWSVYLIEFMLTEGHAQWKTRCDKVHEKVKRNETEQARKTINSKVTALYTVAMEVGYRDRYHIFSKTLEVKLRESVYQLQRWVALNSPAVKQAAHDFKRRNKAQTKDIRTYFGAQLTPIKKYKNPVRKKTRASKSMANTTTITDQPT
jgi:hypothetical protein